VHRVLVCGITTKAIDSICWENKNGALPNHFQKMRLLCKKFFPANDHFSGSEPGFLKMRLYTGHWTASREGYKLETAEVHLRRPL
jgi:hypothetical protein